VRHQLLWTPERLRIGMHSRLRGNRLFVVSNREPYEHMHRGRLIEARVPPSGVVTAHEPILCACDGTWLAHGPGDADRDVVDDRGRVRVPPDHPRYTLHRVTRIEGDRLRIVALLGYVSAPGTTSTDYLRRIRYGRTR
jgi:trehalose 6-phosphate synthase